MSDVVTIVERFNAAWGSHDLEAALSCLADDAVFESTAPAPDGERFVGRDAIRAAWAPIFADAAATFTTETSDVGADFLVQTWRYDWGTGHVRGIDLIRVRDGAVTAKCSYVKG